MLFQSISKLQKDLTSFKSYTYVTYTTRSPLLMITSSRIVCFCNIFCLVYCCTNYNYIIHKLENQSMESHRISPR